MERTIRGFHRDEDGEWVADLSCGHSQHMRHDPPWRERPWTQTASGREARIGTVITCRQCDKGD